MRSSTSKRNTLGISSCGFCTKRLYNSWRFCLPIFSMSRKPFVVNSADLGNSRFSWPSKAFVAMVVAWMTIETSASLVLLENSSNVLITVLAGSLGVDGSFIFRISPLSSLRATRSVKVPPMSMLTRYFTKCQRTTDSLRSFAYLRVSSSAKRNYFRGICLPYMYLNMTSSYSFSSRYLCFSSSWASLANIFPICFFLYLPANSIYRSWVVFSLFAA